MWFFNPMAGGDGEIKSLHIRCDYKWRSIRWQGSGEQLIADSAEDVNGKSANTTAQDVSVKMIN
jgi:hypothetical protein